MCTLSAQERADRQEYLHTPRQGSGSGRTAACPHGTRKRTPEVWHTQA
jgi:hypothetical protein